LHLFVGTMTAILTPISRDLQEEKDLAGRGRESLLKKTPDLGR